MVIYTVQPGESVYTIARQFGLTPEDVLQYSYIPNGQIIPGEALIIPADHGSHLVLPGDSLYAIGRMHGVSVDELLQMNPFIQDPDKIYIGQTLNIPSAFSLSHPIDICGYVYPNVREDVLEKTLPYLTYINPFSYQILPDGSLDPISDERIIEAALAQHVAPMMVITNLRKTDSFNSQLASDVLNSPAARQNLLNNVQTVMEEKQYYGLNINFEYLFPADREAYNSFLAQTYAQLHPQGYWVTTCVAPKTFAGQPGILYEAHDYPAHGENVDQVMLMTYEWGYAFGPPQAIAPLDKVEEVVQYAVSVIPSQKILLGMPNYGYDWTLPFSPGSTARSITNESALRLAQEQGVRIEFDPVAQAPFYNYYDSRGREHVVWFDDARSIAARLRLVEKYNLGGLGYWNLNNYFAQNWLVIADAVEVNHVI